MRTVSLLFTGHKFEYTRLDAVFPQPIAEGGESVTLVLNLPDDDELDGWLMLSQDTFSFWDNPHDDEQ